MRSENEPIQFKRGGSASWTAKNITLRDGEPGFERDTRKFKIGDGETPWNELEYGSGGKSAYDIAIEHGFMGDEESWLESLRGDSSTAPIEEITMSVLNELEPPIDLVVLFNNALA